jgi:hypothetical protein
MIGFVRGRVASRSSLPDEIRWRDGATRLGGNHGEVPTESGGLLGSQM